MALFEDVTYRGNECRSLQFCEQEFELCVFDHCDLSEADLSFSVFIDCTFSHCNLSMVKLGSTVFRDVQFSGCKISGVLFDDCNANGLGFTFRNCILNHSSFYKTRIRKTLFEECQLKEVDFSGTDITGAVFKDCDLTDAKFENTVLEKADLRTAFNYTIDPEKNRLKQARFSMPGVAGLLHKYNIRIE